MSRRPDFSSPPPPRNSSRSTAMRRRANCRRISSTGSRMYRLPGSIAVAALIAGACASTTVRPPAPPEPVTAADVAALTELMQHEDTRTFDAAAFDRLASSQSQLIRTRTMLAAGRIGNRAATNLLLRGLADPADSVRT